MSTGPCQAASALTLVRNTETGGGEQCAWGLSHSLLMRAASVVREAHHVTCAGSARGAWPVSYTHLRAHETSAHL
eukprot:6522045-Alexandrium_andersonii.AAC.1